MQTFQNGQYAANTFSNYNYHKVAVTIEQIGTLENPVIDETMV